MGTGSSNKKKIKPQDPRPSTAEIKGDTSAAPTANLDTIVPRVSAMGGSVDGADSRVSCNSDGSTEGDAGLQATQQAGSLQAGVTSVPSKSAKSTGQSERCLVYLGASAPVHATHTRLIRESLDEGFDRVFVFILCWSPDRAGVAAGPAAAQLAQWLLGFPAADRAKVVVDMVRHEGEGAAKVRPIPAPAAPVA